jgi:outer membrane receptor protein involved in Fe transport
MLQYLFRALVVSALLAGGLFAQATAGQAGIRGTVRDASGATIPGASVTITNPQRGITRQLVSNEAGLFNVPDLTPTTGYVVAVSKEGFAKYEAQGIELQVGQIQEISAVLQVSSSTQQVEVTSAVPLVDVNQQGVSQVVNQAQIDQLPINGRRVDTFVLLTPGVTNDATFGLVSFRGIAGGNAFLTDGNDTTNQFYNENAGRTRISSQISQDAVQEFQVLTDGYSAEYGRAVGGVVNTVTRSGSNDFHGTAYGFFRNKSLNAVDRYAAGYNPPEVRDQDGASLGGPIFKNKLFFFLNGEVTYRNFPGLNRIIDNRLINSAGVFTGVCSAPATPAQCQAAANFITPFNNVSVARSVHQQLGFGKIDWHPTDADTVSFSLNYLRWVSPNGIQTQAVLTNNNLISGNANSSVRSRYGRADWTHIVTPTQVNEVRFGWFKDRLADDANPALWPVQTGPLYISVYGIPVGAASQYPRILPSENRFEIADNYSWTAGRHNLKFGGDVFFNEDYVNQLSNRYGSYAYNSFAAFAADFTNNFRNAKNYNNFTQALGNPVLDFNTNDYDFYIQDQWKITPKFTWNMGLRYEYTSLDQPKIFNPAYPATGRINQPTLSFAPRAGFAYQINNKTVVRSGFGVYYARLQGALLDNLYLTNGLYQPSVFIQPTSASAPVFPAIFPPNATGLPGGTINLQFAQPGLRKPYTLQYDFAIERQLTGTTGLTVSYVGSRGNQFFTARDLNAGPLSNNLVNYTILNPAGQVAGTYSTRTYQNATKLDPRFGQITEIDNGGQTWYDALVVQIDKRFSHGLQGSVAYTYSHALDNFGQGGGSDVVFPGISTYYNGDVSNNKGTSALDQRHRLVVTSLWSPTLSHGSGWFARYVANGWSLSQITTFATPQHSTATINVSSTTCNNTVPTGIPCSNVTGLYRTTTINGLGGSSRVPFLPLSSLDIDNTHRVDARLTKEFAFTERFKLHLFFEAFDVFNTISNTGVFTSAYTAVGNVLIPNTQAGQGNASQGFPDGTNARRMQVGARFMF